MQYAACVVLTAFLADCTENPFTTPAGVKHTTVYPQVKLPTSPPILNCTTLDSSLPRLDGLLRPWSGLLQYSAKHIKASFAKATLSALPDIKYLASQAANIPALASPELLGLCESRKLVLDANLSYADAFCQCAPSRHASDTCATLKQFVEATMCPSMYTLSEPYDCQDIDRRLTTFDALSPTCSGPVVDGVSYLELPMINLLNSPGAVLPNEINLDHELLKTEGSTYYLAFAATERAALFGEAHSHCSSRDVTILPTWDTVLHINAAQPGEKGTVPAVVVSQQKEAFLVTVRDMQTTFEGRLAAQLELGFKFLNTADAVQEGLATATAALMPPLDALLEAYFTTHELVHPRIIVVGAGIYGGGTAAAIANHLAKQWAVDRPWSSIISVDAIVFSGPRVGSTQFTDSYRTLVNGRHISSHQGVGGMIPCGRQTMCTSRQSAFAVSSQVEPGAVVEYGSLPGTIWLDSPDAHQNLQALLAGIGDKVNKDKKETPFSNRMLLAANTVCAPKCWLSLRFCPDDKHNMCDKQTCPALLG